MAGERGWGLQPAGQVACIHITVGMYSHEQHLQGVLLLLVQDCTTSQLASVLSLPPPRWHCALQGPIARLLLSCQLYCRDDPKIAAFCTFTAASPDSTLWGHELYHFYLLLLLCIKRLLSGLWKGVLRDWASVAGAC